MPRDVDAPPPGRAAPAVSGPGGGEAGNGGTMLVLGLLLALVVTALLLWLRRRGASTIKPPTVTAGKAVSRQQELPRPDETPPPSLWRKAEELAAKGEYLEALRVLHAAVLALLAPPSIRALRADTDQWRICGSVTPCCGSAARPARTV